MCLEKRAFYRAVSGLHTSINIHLCAQYLSREGVLGQAVWGPNPEEFERRFGPQPTGGEGPQWLRNLYFVYLLELGALARASPYLLQETFYTSKEDDEVRTAVRALLDAARCVGLGLGVKDGSRTRRVVGAGVGSSERKDEKECD